LYLTSEKFRKKDETKQIALGTSKTNYNDPRISVVWCKKNEVKIEKIFTKNLLSKFLWAMYTDLDW
jgi:DNA topoisomerase-1